MYNGVRFIDEINKFYYDSYVTELCGSVLGRMPEGVLDPGIDDYTLAIWGDVDRSGIDECDLVYMSRAELYAVAKKRAAQDTTDVMNRLIEDAALSSVDGLL